jgi:hypothetical protein
MAFSECVGELSPPPAMANPAPDVLRSRDVPYRVRLLPRVTPVLSVLKTVHRSTRLDNSGEFLVAVHGGGAVSTSNSGGRASLFPSHQIPAVRSEINGPGWLIPLRGFSF